MTPRPNLETSQDSHPIEQEISIVVGAEAFKFVLAVPRYVHSKLRREDWVKAGEGLRAEKDRHVRDAVMNGSYFSVAGMEALRERIRQSMCDLIYDRFVELQIEAGNESWGVPQTLQRAG